MTLSTKSLEERLTPSSKQVPLIKVLTQMYRAVKFCWCSVHQTQIPCCHKNAHQMLRWSHRPLVEGAVIIFAYLLTELLFVKSFFKKKSISKLLPPFLVSPEQKNDTFLKGFRLHKWSKTADIWVSSSLILISLTLRTLSVAWTALWWEWTIVSQLWLISEKEFQNYIPICTSVEE